MANTSARMLRLLSLLQTHRFWPGGELADRLEVSPRTLRRDVDRLRELGYLVEANRGVAGGYQLQAGGAVPPLLLDDDEAVAIAVGLQSAAALVGSTDGGRGGASGERAGDGGDRAGSGRSRAGDGGDRAGSNRGRGGGGGDGAGDAGARAGTADGIEETSVRALAKVIQLLPPRLRRRIDALRAVSSPGVFGGGPVLAPQTLTTIALACRSEERLRFGYTAREAGRTDRHVEPHRLVALGRRWYLIAWDLDRADWRSFRVDRITDPEPTAAHFRPRDIPGGDPVAWLRSRLTSVPARYEVSVVVALPAEEVRRVIGRYGTVEPLPDDGEGPTSTNGAEDRAGPGRPRAQARTPVDGESRQPAGSGRSPAEVRMSAAQDGEDPVGDRPGRCRLRMDVDDLSWPVMVLGVMDAAFTVEAPPELKDRLRAVATSLLRYAGEPAGRNGESCDAGRGEPPG